MNIKLITHKDEVLLVFEEPMMWVSLTAAQARDIAEKILALVHQLEGQPAKSN
jgi:hypothetical protein